SLRRTARSIVPLPTHDRIVRAAADNPLQSVWQVMDVGGQTAAGVYIFTGKHYSIMFATTDRPQVDDTSKATADELRAMWGPMAANAGTDGGQCGDIRHLGESRHDQADRREDTGGHEAGRERSVCVPRRGQHALVHPAAKR